MDENTRPKLILLGIFLAVVVLGYFLFQRLVAPSTNKTTTVAKAPVVRPTTPVPTPLIVTPLPAATTPAPTPTPTPATLAQATTKGGGKLPNTGVEEDLLAVFAIAIVIAGFSLRQFPN